MAVASPSVALFTGQDYLRASGVGVNLDGGSALSVAVVVDPNLLGADQSGTIVSKHNPGANQNGWVMSYDAGTGLITVSIYDSAAGTNVISRVTNVPIMSRAVVVFTFDLTSGNIHLYVNGAAADGTQTGSIASIATNTERLAVFADSTSGTAQNACRGGFYYLAIWRVTLTSGEVATIDATGVTPTPLLTGHTLVANFPSALMTQLTDGHFNTWIDTVASLGLIGTAISGDTPLANLTTLGSRLITVNKWDYTLADSGNPGGLGLTSTYTPSAPFLLWGPSESEPQRASNYRIAINDITILCRARKVIGTTNVIYIRLHGLIVEYDLSSKELFAIVGDDTSNTGQNQRVSFGFNLFPVEGAAVDLVMRYNAVDKQIDVFIGSTKYSQSVAPTNAFETTTGLFFSTNADFVLASVVPACIDDAAVALLIAGNQSVAYSPGFETQPFGYEETLYPVFEPDVTDLPTAVDDDLIPYAGASAYPIGLETRELGFSNSPYPVIDEAKNLFVDPNPQIVSVTVDTNHHVTGVGVAGPTDAYLTYSYWEIELEAGVSIIVIDEIVSTQFFAARTTITNYWDVPTGSLWNGLRIRFVIQAVNDSSQIWYSPWQILNDPNFDHESGSDTTIGVYNDPLSSIQAVTVDSMHNVTAVAMSGPITPAGSTATLHYWEIEMDTGAVFSCGAMAVDGQINTSRVQIVDHFKVPVGEVWNCRRIRFAVRIEDAKHRHVPTIFYSDWYRLKDPNFNLPGLPPVEVPIWPGAVNPVSDNPIVPPLSLDLFDVTEYTFGAHSALFPIGSLVNFDLTVDPSIDGPQWFNNGMVMPPGLYTITYTAGSRFNMTTSLWNDFYQGNFGTGSRGMWIQSGMNFPYYVFQAPAFLPGGYNTQNAAETAAIGYQFIFYHIGGPLGIIFDLDDCSYTGSISLHLNDTQGNDIPGEWQIVEQAAGGRATIVDPGQEYPTLRGLVRGQTHLRYIVRGDDHKPRWQDAYIRVWPSPGVTNQAQQLDPNAPPKPFPADPTNSAKLIHNRSSIVLPPPTSGNKG